MQTVKSCVQIRLIAYTILVVGTAAAQAPADFQPRLAMLRSEESAGSLTSQRAVLALWYAARQLHVPPEEIPRIIVILSTPHSAKVARLPALPNPIPSAGAAAVMRDDVEGEPVYFLWIIGKNSDPWLSQGMVTILSLHRGLDPATQNESVLRVLRSLSATRSEAELRATTHNPP